MIYMKKTNKIEIAVLVAIILLAAVMRLTNLDWEAFSWNEGTHFGGALEYARGNFIYNFNDYATPPFMKYLGAIVYSIFGFSEILLRIIPALFGIATIGLTYYFAKRYYDIYIAIFSSILVAFSIIHLTFSRLYLTEVIVGFFYLTVLFAYFTMIKKPTKKYIVLFGIFLGLALLTKYLSLYLLIAIILHAIISKNIRFKKKQRTGIEIDNFLLKGFLIALLTFFIIWPFSLYPIKVHFYGNVVDFPQRDDSFTLNLPGIILSPEEYLTSAFGRQEVFSKSVQSNIISIPVIGYLFIFMAKESIFFGIIMILGLAAIFRKRKSIDRSVLFIFFVFLILLWFQRYGWTYRYMTAIIPLIAIISARSLDLIKKNNVKILFIFLVGTAVFAESVYAYPNYTLHYNVLDNISNFKPIDSEIMMLDGYREGIDFVKSNCSKVTGEFARSTVDPDKDPTGFVISNVTKQDLAFCVYVTYDSNLPKEIEKILDAQCTLTKEISRGGINLRSVYMCRAK